MSWSRQYKLLASTFRGVQSFPKKAIFSCFHGESSSAHRLPVALRSSPVMKNTKAPGGGQASSISIEAYSLAIHFEILELTRLVS